MMLFLKNIFYFILFILLLPFMCIYGYVLCLCGKGDCVREFVDSLSDFKENE